MSCCSKLEDLEAWSSFFISFYVGERIAVLESRPVIIVSGVLALVSSLFMLAKVPSQLLRSIPLYHSQNLRPAAIHKHEESLA